MKAINPSQYSSLSPTNHQKIKKQFLKTKIQVKYNLSPLQIGENHNCLRNYFNMFPQHKKKHNFSAYNFVGIKNHQKEKEETQNMCNEEGGFIVRKKNEPISSISTQRLQLYPRKTHERVINTYLKRKLVNNEEQKIAKMKQNDSLGMNKLQELMSKNAKFDRKKYMYYRYRKKSSFKTHITLKDIPAVDQQKVGNGPKKSNKFINIKSDAELKNAEDCSKLQLPETQKYKMNWYGVIIGKVHVNVRQSGQYMTKTINRKDSKGVFDRQAYCRTTRSQSRYIKWRQQNVGSRSKIFPQAVHFRSRRRRDEDGVQNGEDDQRGGNNNNNNNNNKNNGNKTGSKKRREQQIRGWEQREMEGNGFQQQLF